MSAVDNVFLDANVPVYAHDRSEPTKGALAQTLLSQLFSAGQPVFSVQVLSEFYWAVTRKLSIPLTHDEAVAQINRFQLLGRPVPVTQQILGRALQLIALHQMPLWDAQILAAAALNGASLVLSEDFQHRQTLEGVTFLNPFAADFDINEVLTP